MQSWYGRMLTELNTHNERDQARRVELADRFDREARWEMQKLRAVDGLSRDYESLGRLERLPRTDAFSHPDKSPIVSPVSD